MGTAWTSASAIDQWNSIPHETMVAMDLDGDFAKRHLVNPTLLRMLGPLPGRRVLDAGCGQGYMSRMLARRGAEVVGVEPADTLFGYATRREAELRQDIRYVQADLTRPPALGEPFDAVVCSMVLQSIPDWRAAMRACVAALRPGGLFVFAVNHPAFENLWGTWREHGEYRLSRYLTGYDMPQRYATDFHRPLSAYFNEVVALGCALVEVAEPALDARVAREAEPTMPGITAYVDLPAFLIVAARAGG
ncbi:methyltransferase domain-containing protein [Longispora sp. K20-0274]|uniref:class I SAM-dependent methyltransferase n=1 Tax=Longispora sp. K20-0274 TaxID=3088255 RepID=UPI003999EE3B